MAKHANVALRPMLPADGPVLAAIFVASVEELTGDDYDAAQQTAWASLAEDEPAFVQRLTEMLTLVATIGGAPVGFASLKAPSSLEMLYVHPAVAGQGVATTLCDACEKLAGARAAKDIVVQASDTAQGFFAKRGYTAWQRSTVTLGEEWLGRIEMRKPLAANANQA